MKRNILSLALLSVFAAEAESQQSTAVQTTEPATQVQPQSGPDMAPPQNEEETNAKELGARRARLIVGADAAIETAFATASQTRIDAHLELTHIMGERARNVYIAMLEYEWKTALGGELPKTKKSLISELKKTAGNMTAYLAGPAEAADAEVKALRAKLTGKGTYAEKMKMIPRIDTRGGANRDTGTAGTVQAIKDSQASGTPINTEDIENLRKMKEAGINPANVVKATGQQPAQPQPNADQNNGGGNRPTVNTVETEGAHGLTEAPASSTGAVNTRTGATHTPAVGDAFRTACRALTEAEVESAVGIFAVTLQKFPAWLELGNMLADWIDHTDADQTHQTEAAATGTHG